MISAWCGRALGGRSPGVWFGPGGVLFAPGPLPKGCMICKQCGGENQAAILHFCSTECRNNNDHYYAAHRMRRIFCPDCEEFFEAVNLNSVYCPKCASARKNRRVREKRRAIREERRRERLKREGQDKVEYMGVQGVDVDVNNAQFDPFTPVPGCYWGARPRKRESLAPRSNKVDFSGGCK